MKRTVFLVDSKKKEVVADFLQKNGIVFDYNDRFHFDFRTAVATIVVGGILLVILTSIF